MSVVHFWANDDAVKLAHALRAGLDTAHVVGAEGVDNLTRDRRETSNPMTQSTLPQPLHRSKIDERWFETVDASDG